MTEQYGFGVDGKMKKLLAKSAVPAIVIALVLLSLCPVIFAETASAAPSLSIEGALADISLSPGQTYIHKMTITNGADTALDILVEARGFGQTLDGSNIELTSEEDNSPYSARQYITGIDKPSFHLEPGGSEVINATIQVPQSISPGTRYAIIYVHSLPTGEGKVGYIVAADVPVILTVPGSTLQETGSITDLTVPEIKSGQPLQVLTTFKNTGNYHYKVKNQVIITDESGATVSNNTSTLTSSSLVPTYSRLFTVAPTLPDAASGLPAGNYNVLSKIMLDDSTVLATKQASFSVSESYQRLPGLCENSIVVTDFHDEIPSIIDAMSKADTKVELIDTGKISGTVIIGKYCEDPETAISFSDAVGTGGMGKSSIKYVYVHADGISQGTARITVHFTDAEVSGFDVNSLFLAYFDGTTWQKLNNMTVYTGAGTVVGDMPISALSGTVIGLGGDRIESAASQPSGISWSIAGGAIAGALIVGSGVVFLLNRRRKTIKQ